ncbi:MAG: hypothetical protein JWL75_809 [Parcubacteria group bacterium]|nr:hypothetical protein [Parcubacteria group bacterium]
MSSNALGLQRGTVVLSEYTPEWHQLFEEEKVNLATVLGTSTLSIEHIGSTAIPGIKAKPILDLMVAIPRLDGWEQYIEALGLLSYEFRRDFRHNQQHILFVKGPEKNRTHYLKLTELNSEFWKEHIIFRDYLITHPEKAQEYQKLKEFLLAEHSGDRGPYTEGKKRFVQETLRLAGYTGEFR